MRKKLHGVAERPSDSDWARVDALTDEEIEAAVRDDPDAAPIVDAEWFAGATLVMPEPKEQISIRLDAERAGAFPQIPALSNANQRAILRAPQMEHEKKAAG